MTFESVESAFPTSDRSPIRNLTRRPIWRWQLLRAAVMACLGWFLTLAHGAPIPLTTATFTTFIDGSASAPSIVALHHRWEVMPGPALSRARYDLVLPEVVSDEPYALLLSRVGNQVQVRLGDMVIYRGGRLGDDEFDAAKRPVLIPIPTNGAPATSLTGAKVTIDITAQPSRWAGLGAVQWGPVSELEVDFRWRYGWRVYGSIGTAVCFAIVALLAFWLWRIDQDTVYLKFCLGASLGVLVYFNRMVQEAPLPWSMWGPLMLGAILMHLFLMLDTALDVDATMSARSRRAFDLVSLVIVVLAVSLHLAHRSKELTWVLVNSLVLTVGVAAVTLRTALRRLDRQSFAIALGCGLNAVAMVWETLAVRLFGDGSGTVSLAIVPSFGACLVLCFLLVDRHARQTHAYRDLLVNLDARIRETEAELRISHERIQQHSAEQAVLNERQRIMRDIHDGVGAHLVGLMSMISKGQSAQSELQEHARAALDELRMAVDAMQPVNGDLATVLATLRYRLQPRFAAAGIEVDWHVDELPFLEHLTPKVVLQIQRILLEAFTNVLRHAQASRIRVSAHEQGAQDSSLVLEIADDGIGLSGEVPPAGGQGVRNMKARAESIGGRIHVTGQPSCGTLVQLIFPLRN